MSLNDSSMSGVTTSSIKTPATMAPAPAPMLVVAAALFDADGRVLMQRRPSHKAHGGSWEFPGGKVEHGESPQQALARELHEELGIHVETADLLPVTFAADRDDGHGIVLLLFACHRWRGEPAMLEATALCWDEPARLARLPMPPLDMPLVAHLARDVETGRR